MKLKKVKEPWNAKRLTVIPVDKLDDGTVVAPYYTDEKGARVIQYERIEKPDGKIEWFKVDY